MTGFTIAVLTRIGASADEAVARSVSGDNVRRAAFLGSQIVGRGAGAPPASTATHDVRSGPDQPSGRTYLVDPPKA